MRLKKHLQKTQFFLAEWYRTMDTWLLWSIAALIVCGIFLTFSASPGVAERILKTQDTFYFVKKQLFFLIPSIGLMLGVSMLSPKQIRRLAFIVFAGSLIALILTLFVGMEVKGAKRWLYFPGFSIQPSEFMKPAFAVICAWIFASGRLIDKFPGIRIAGCVYLMTIVLLLLQPDIGQTLTISTIWGCQLFLAGISVLWVVALLGIGIVGVLGTYFVFPHVQSRIDRFLNPQTGDVFQVRTSLEAFHNGGWFGRGPGEGIIPC